MGHTEGLEGKLENQQREIEQLMERLVQTVTDCDCCRRQVEDRHARKSDQMSDECEDGKQMTGVC